MKFTVEGFSQQKAVEMGLSAEDLTILRWFVDFQGSDKMMKFTTEDGIYVWVNYNYFLEDMPIVKGNRKNLSTKFQRLVDAGVLKHTTVKQGGTFSAYCFGPRYKELVSSNNTSGQGHPVPNQGHPVPNQGHPVPNQGHTVGLNEDTPLPQSGTPKINLLNNQSTNIKESKENAPDKPAHRSSKFVQPSLDEVKTYCSERGKGVDPEQWYDHYQSNGWMVGKTHMKDWKAAVRTWEHRNLPSKVPSNSNPWGGVRS